MKNINDIVLGYSYEWVPKINKNYNNKAIKEIKDEDIKLKERNDVMSWGCYSVLKCNKCGTEYIVDEDTLTLNTPLYNKCPKCHSDGTIISTNSMITSMNKQKLLFKNRKKRCNL